MARKKRRRSRRKPPRTPTKPRDTDLRRQTLEREAIDAAESGGPGLPDTWGTTVTAHDRAVVSLQYEGPLPPPRILLEYDQAIPGAGERILRESERQSEHRRSMESKLVEGSVSWNRRGQTFAFVVVLTALIGGMWLVVLDRPIWGLGTLITAIAGLAGSFLLATRRRRARRSNSRKASDEKTG